MRAKRERERERGREREKREGRKRLSEGGYDSRGGHCPSIHTLKKKNSSKLIGGIDLHSESLRRPFRCFSPTSRAQMALRGRVLSVLARTGLQRLLTERGGGASTAVSMLRVPPTMGGWQTPNSASFLRIGGTTTLRFFSPPPPPLPTAAAREEEKEERGAATPPRAAETPSAEPSPSPLGRAPTAATAAFALAEMARPAACTRVDLATKLLDADHAMSTPTYTREYLVKKSDWRGRRERKREE